MYRSTRRTEPEVKLVLEPWISVAEPFLLLSRIANPPSSVTTSTLAADKPAAQIVLMVRGLRTAQGTLIMPGFPVVPVLRLNPKVRAKPPEHNNAPFRHF